MTKFVSLILQNGGASTTVSTVAAGTDQILLDNSNGKSPIRLDKLLLQWSGYLSGSPTKPHGLSLIVHLTDKSGNSLTASITNNTTTIADYNTLLQKWKDNLFMTDHQMLGTGSDETNIFVSNMEADTRRILEPGQKLIFSVVAISTESVAVTPTGMADTMLWYSPAAE